jgi:hypothetical protein
MGIAMYVLDRKNVMFFFGPEGKTLGQGMLVWMLLGIILVRYMNKKALDG